MKKNICPFCGNENNPESKTCSVCKADLTSLPQDLYPVEDETPILSVPKNTPKNESDVIPSWMKRKLEESTENPNTISFNNYLNAIFGDTSQAPAGRTPKKNKPASEKTVGKKKDPAQLSLSIWDDAPLRDGTDPVSKPFDASDEVYDDFSTYRPEQKWDDADEDPSEPQLDTEFSAVGSQSAGYADDAPLYEGDLPEEDDDNAEVYKDSVSPTKLADPEDMPDEAAQEPVHKEDELEFDEGSLISDLMRTIDEEKKPDNDGPLQDEDIEALISNAVENAAASNALDDSDHPLVTPADLLDRSLMDAGYQRDGECGVFIPADGSANDLFGNPEAGDHKDVDPEADQTAEDLSETAKSQSEPTGLQEELRTDLNEIPWNLFESGDMFITMPEEEGYRTFSRAQIPAPNSSSDYQQRMVTTLIDALQKREKQPRTTQREKRQAIGTGARIFFAVLAILGCVLIMLTGKTDRFPLAFSGDPVPDTAFLTDAGDEVLISIDYSFAYGAELDDCLYKTIDTLLEHGTKVRLQTLSMGALPFLKTVYGKYGIDVDNEGYLAGNAAAVRSLLEQGRIPSHVILFASDLPAVRTWAEQLYGEDPEITLDVIGSAQLSTIVQPYVDSGMIRKAIVTPVERLRFSGKDLQTAENARPVWALWFMILLTVFAWLCGSLAGFLKRDPDIKSVPKSPGESQMKSYIPISSVKESRDGK